MRSASFILAGILLFAVGCAGGDSATEDDDAALRAGHATPQPVKPILECVAPGPHHLDVALFGFANESSEQVIIPIGPSNHFLPPGPAARSQPTRFAPGRQHGAFTVPFFERATWRLGLHTATAHRHSPRCSAAETALVQELERIKAHFANRYAERAVVHHFDEVFGFTIDCVDINQQPGLRGTGLTLVRHPTNPPPPAPAPAPGRQVLPRLSGGTDQNGAARMCPPDTVPIRRFALEDVRAFETLENVVRHGPAPGQRPAPQPTTEGEHYSHVGYQAKQQTTHGNAALLTVENPDLDEDVLHEVDHSIAQVWTYAGCQVNDPTCASTGLQTIESGWIKEPEDLAPRFFIYHTTDNYTDRTSNSCYNLDCAGANHNFIQTSSDMVLDFPLQPTSPPAAAGRDPTKLKTLAMSWYKDGDDGDWFLNLTLPDGTVEQVGYYPHTIFDTDGLRNAAQVVQWGGEVYDENFTDTTLERTLTDMGSGAASTDVANAASISGLSEIKGNANAYTGAFGSKFSNGGTCYDGVFISGITSSDPDNPAVTLFYGGRGADCH